MAVTMHLSSLVEAGCIFLATRPLPSPQILPEEENDMPTQQQEENDVEVASARAAGCVSSGYVTTRIMIQY